MFSSLTLPDGLTSNGYALSHDVNSCNFLFSEILFCVLVLTADDIADFLSTSVTAISAKKNSSRN